MNNITTNVTVALSMTLCGTAVVTAAPKAKTDAAKQPNVIVILIDDLGYGDIEPFGSTRNKTPNLNVMAEQGICFTSFYAAALSSPSRASLMTGCYPKRVGLSTGSWHGVIMPNDTHGLDPDEFILPEVFKAQGYVTGCFGKWHLGDQEAFLPPQQGFDEYYGIPYSNDLWQLHSGSSKWKYAPENIPVLRGNEIVDNIVDMKDQANLCKMVTDAAIDFIKENRKNPFFAYIPHAFIHQPRNARDEFYNEEIPYDNVKMASDLKYYSSERAQAAIQEVDWSVGEIFKTLKKLGLDDNTLVIFTSDNGGNNTGSSNAPFSGFKGSTQEGGIRVPTIMWWQGVIESGSSSDEVASIMDILPTMAGIVGTELPKGRKIDGKNILPLMRGDEGAKSPWDALFFHSKGVLESMRSGNWKYFANGRLYDLDSDPAEKKNIAKDNPEVIAKMEKYIDAMHKDLDNPLNCRMPGYNKDPKPIF
ncbi:MAG: sulfatase [Rikenellaceae bacterium]